MCNLCVDDYAFGLNGLCKPCASGGTVLDTPTVVIIVFAVGALGYMIKDQLSQSRPLKTFLLSFSGKFKGLRESFSKLTGGEGISAQTKTDRKFRVKVLISFCQVLYQFRDLFGVSWPPTFAKILSSLSLVNLNVLALSGLACELPTNFIDRFLSVAVLPAIGAGAMAGFCFLARQISQQRSVRPWLRSVLHTVWNVGTKLLLLLLFFLFPGACSATLRVFPCISLKDGSQWLAADHSIQCRPASGLQSALSVPTFLFGESLSYQKYRYLGYVMIAMWPIGTPLLFYSALYSCSKRASADPDSSIQAANLPADQETPEAARRTSKRKEDRPLTDLSFMTSDYKDWAWYWEILECYRKLLLTGVTLFVWPRSPEQICFGLVVTSCAMALYTRVNPYKDRVDSILAMTSQLSTCFCLIGALLLKFKQLNNQLAAATG